MGTGKTRLALHAFKQSGFREAIVVTRRVAFSSWVEEVIKCELKFSVWSENPPRLLYIPKGGSYGTIILVSADKLKARPTSVSKTLLIVDELYMFANPKSKRSIELSRFSCACPARIGLSGSIMPARDNFAIFGQLKALGIHKSLARNATEFRNQYQDILPTQFGTSSKNKLGSKEVILSKISSFVDVYYPESRPTRIQIITVPCTPLQKDGIKQLRKTYEWKGIEYKFASGVQHAINGISGGWYNDITLASSKLDRLFSLVDEIVAEGEKVIIWCGYIQDIERISSELKQHYVVFSGKHKFDSGTWESGKIYVVLASESMGASVNHFKDVKYAIYYSINYKTLDLDQSMGRTERKSSTHEGAHYYFLQTTGTLDKRIYNLVAESKKQENEIIKTLSLVVDNTEEL